MRPPVGNDLVLDANQIRYCLAEKIRLNVINSLVSSQSTQDVEGFNRIVRFNLKVDDYNSRCAQFRYEVDTFDRVRKDVEAHRKTIEQQARHQWKAEK
jgi:hypothetical protein